MDPQHRILLECAWEAMEDSGHDPWAHPGRIGVFATAGKDTYLLFNLLSHGDWMHSEEVFQLLLGNEKDYLSSRISYKLNLTGPSVTIQSACSSSLVAVHMACQSLTMGECDMALVGGVSVDVPRAAGYLYRAGGILSPDGHCKAFDAEAKGTTFGHGAGVIVLRKAADALADGDSIRALIRGTAVNNDGCDKAGFTAPSIKGQAQVIREALEVAGVSPDTITYVEGHGTATPIGDPIEVQALTKAFRTYTNRKQYCALGSVKTNLGHLGPAAGISGIIKTILSLGHAEIPPSLHFRSPNPQIDFATTPFFVNTELRPWSSHGPKRAGVSSFGQGGTNAHVILEEAPTQPDSTSSCHHNYVLLLSGQNAGARDAATRRLAEFLITSPQDLADIAYTLQIGRRHFSHRRIVLCENKKHAIETLLTLDPNRVIDSSLLSNGFRAVFEFPDIPPDEYEFPATTYGTEKQFREVVDDCVRHSPGLRDFVAAYFPNTQPTIKDNCGIIPEDYPLITFITQYAMARMWQAWGINAEVAGGYGVGSLVASTLKGALPVDDALRSVRDGNWDANGSDSLMAADKFIPLVIAPRCNRILEQFVNGPVVVCGDSPTRAIGELWLNGITCNWAAYYSDDRRQRVSLPTYPFQRKRHWIEPRSKQPIGQSADISSPQNLRGSGPREHPASAAQIEATLVEVFGAVLGVKQVGKHDDFFELGGHSLLEIQVRGRVEKTLGVTLPQGVLFEHGTVAELAQVVLDLQVHSPSSSQAKHVDPISDVVLDDTISATTSSRVVFPPMQMFMTGATGFLGVHLLEQLLKSTEAHVYFLVRAATREKGYRKLIDAASVYGIRFDTLLSRVTPVLGDLASPHFGISAHEYEQLAACIAAVYHCGAYVNFVQPYRSLKPINVDGTREVLRFAATSQLKAVHHISSVAVFESETFASLPRAFESTELTDSRGFHNGYDMSKWVAEGLTTIARERSIPVSVYRISNIAGHSDTGIMLPQHIVACLIKGCVQLGVAPGDDKIINLLPVDAASTIIGRLSLRPGALGRTFHVVNPIPARIREIIRWLNERGYAIEARSYDEWREMLRIAPDDNVFKLFLPLLDEAPLFTDRSYDMTNVRAHFPTIDSECPPFDEVLLDRYLTYMVSTGYLMPAPKRVRHTSST